jgi:rRNA maturation RNase YbeY
MQELNAAFRGVDKPTDVLSFPQIEFGVQDSGFRGGAKDHILGDIVINIQRAVIQAKMSCRRLYDEIYLLMIHGILHLLGYEHEGSRSKAMVMRRKEREIINAIKKVV